MEGRFCDGFFGSGGSTESNDMEVMGRQIHRRFLWDLVVTLSPTISRSRKADSETVSLALVVRLSRTKKRQWKADSETVSLDLVVRLNRTIWRLWKADSDTVSLDLVVRLSRAR